MSAEQLTVPLYGLYGEPRLNTDSGFVHIEDIAARSDELGWVIKSHRHAKLFQIICIYDAKVEVTLDNAVHQLEGGWAISIPPGVAHGFKFQPNCQGFVLSIDHSLIMDTQENSKSLNLFQLQDGPRVFPLDQRAEEFLNYTRLLRREFEQLQPGRIEFLDHLSKLAILNLGRLLMAPAAPREFNSADAQILAKFGALLVKHYAQHHPISYYAAQLNISKSTLNRMCQKYFGANPKTIVQEKLLGEAKRQLIYTRQPLEEIAFRLGFKDQAYFSRFFKKQQGISPGLFRKERDSD